MTTPQTDTRIHATWYDGRPALAESHGMVYMTTHCCGASGKGSGGMVVCRTCYHEVEWVFGNCWTPSEVAEVIAREGLIPVATAE